jgi:hypothetical protein
LHDIANWDHRKFLTRRIHNAFPRDLLRCFSG